MISSEIIGTKEVVIDGKMYVVQICAPGIAQGAQLSPYWSGCNTMGKRHDPQFYESHAHSPDFNLHRAIYDRT